MVKTKDNMKTSLAICNTQGYFSTLLSLYSSVLVSKLTLDHFSINSKIFKLATFFHLLTPSSRRNFELMLDRDPPHSEP